jgi:subtilisin-like proprotein convertase family protein
VSESWTVGPQESYATPLRALEAKAETTTGSQVINAGNTVLVHIPLESKFKKANLSNVLGLITPLTDGVDVIDPVSDYGNINAGSAGDGSDPFIIQLADTIPCGAQIRLKVDFTSDQGIVGVKDDVLITVGSGIGSPQGALSYPQGAPSGTIGAAYSASATSVQLSSATNMKASAYLKNSRTNEIYLGTSWNQNTKVLGIKRAQKGTTAAAIEAGDELTFDSVPIPDALSAGLQLTVFPTDPNIQGAIGKIKVNLGKFTHPHVQDLRMTLSNSQGYSAVLLENAKPKLDGSTVYQNITIDTSATLSVSTLDGLQDNTSYRPTGDLGVFNNPALDAHSTWTLTVADLSAPFAGDISSWSIELSPLVLCATPTVQSSNFSGGVSGWTPESYGPAAFMDMYYRPENNQGPASLVLNTKANDSIRVPGFRSPGVPLINYPNQVYRFHAYVVRSGQPNMQDQSQVPFMRIRANIGSVMTNIHDYFFGIVNLDAPAAPYGWQIMPSTDRNAPSHYWVDLDPVDAPSLYSDPNHVVTGYIENWSHFAQQQGNIEVVQTKMERYSAPGDDEGQVVCTYTPADLSNGIQYSANLANKTWASDVPYERPRITTSTAGVTLDSSRVPAVGPVSVATFDVTPQNKQETILKANKLYRVRYHISSNTPSSSNPVFRLRARSLRWIDANELVIGPSNFGTERDQLLGRQILPGPGTLNPSHRQGETQGGYYDQYVSSPAVIPTDVDFKTLRFGFDIFDFGYDGNGTDAQKNEGGRFTLDSIQVTEFPQR